MAKNEKKSKKAAEEMNLDEALTAIKEAAEDGDSGIFWAGFKINLEKETYNVSIGVQDPEDRRAKAQFVGAKSESLAEAVEEALEAARKVEFD